MIYYGCRTVVLCTVVHSARSLAWMFWRAGPTVASVSPAPVADFQFGSYREGVACSVGRRAGCGPGAGLLFTVVASTPKVNVRRARRAVIIPAGIVMVVSPWSLLLDPLAGKKPGGAPVPLKPRTQCVGWSYVESLKRVITMAARSQRLPPTLACWRNLFAVRRALICGVSFGDRDLPG